MFDLRRRITGLRAAAATIGVLAACLLGAGAASAAAPWSAPQNLSVAGHDSFIPQDGIDAAGNALALWNGSTGGAFLVQQSSRAGGGAWSAPSDLASVAYVPDLVVLPNGAAMATWWRGGAGKQHIIQAASRAGGVWSAAASITDEEEGELEGKAFNGGYFPHVAANERGDAVVVWQECFSPEDLPTGAAEFGGPACTTEGFEQVGRYVLRASRKLAGEAGWSAPQTIPLSKVSDTAIKARVAIDANGNAAAAWEADELPVTGSSGKVVYASSLGAGETTWKSERLSPVANEAAGEPQVAYDGAGNATALWHSRTGGETGDYLVESAVLNAGESKWLGPVTVSAPGESAFEQQLAVEPNGDALALWRAFPGEQVRAKARIGATWASTESKVSAEGSELREPRVALDPRGDAIALWRRSNGANRIIQAALLPVGGSWSAPVDVSDAGQNAEEPDLAMNSKGYAVAVWRRSDGANQIVQASSLAALESKGGTIPARGGTGKKLIFSASPSALWSAVTTVWRFGDGKSAKGDRVSHAYSKKGAYQVTATSTDALGNVVTTSGRVVVFAGTARVPRVVKVLGNRARLQLRCPNTASCTGFLKLVRGPKAHRIVLGGARFTLPAGKRRTVKVTLRPSGRRLLAHATGHKLGAVLEGSGVKRRAVLLKTVARARR
jgi:PKD domain